MKSVCCGIDVPFTFVKAILNNSCPACGKEIFADKDFKEFIRIKTIFQEIGLEESIGVSAAAAVSQKYDLVLKSDKPPTRMRPLLRKEVEEGEDDTPSLTEEEIRVKAFRSAQKEKEEAKIIEEWGLEAGELSASAVKRGEKKLIDPEMAELFAGSLYGSGEDIDVPANFNGHHSIVNNERLARAEALKNDSSRFKIQRIE